MKKTLALACAVSAVAFASGACADDLYTLGVKGHIPASVTVTAPASANTTGGTLSGTGNSTLLTLANFYNSTTKVINVNASTSFAVSATGAFTAQLSSANSGYLKLDNNNKIAYTAAMDTYK